MLMLASAVTVAADPPIKGDAKNGNLAFGQYRTCHYPEKIIKHNNGPNINSIFGKTTGRQPGFPYYSVTFKKAEFIWSSELLDNWLSNPYTVTFPDATMMSPGVPDPQDRADLIEYLKTFQDKP
ncbi:MAG: adenylate cyclase [Candidatus Thiodiazotropha sp. (ex Monitilora ramsayi)]|nr:adenylate cyclase [Candidatus Thiodiazotropha sp. (ex Monitilora ramsayi)]